MKTTILYILLFGSIMCQAQTKVIAHKSHSGSNNTFAKAYKNNLFDINRSNFGLYKAKIRRLDTVIAVSNSMTIIKFRESKNEYNPGTNPKTLNQSAFIRKTDTLINDKLLNKKNTVKFIKSSTPFIFETPVDSIVFIGFKKK